MAAGGLLFVHHDKVRLLLHLNSALHAPHAEDARGLAEF